MVLSEALVSNVVLIVPVAFIVLVALSWSFVFTTPLAFTEAPEMDGSALVFTPTLVETPGRAVVVLMVVVGVVVGVYELLTLVFVPFAFTAVVVVVSAATAISDVSANSDASEE
jgi:hypothetical protein